MKAVWAGVRHLLDRVPWLVWAALAPAAIIGAVQLISHGRRPVLVVGTGAALALRGEDAPAGERYDLDLRMREPAGEVVDRVRTAVRGYPDIVVVGVPDDASPEQIDAIASSCANAPAALVMMGHGVRARGCRDTALRLCVDVPRTARADAIREMARTAVLEGRRRYERLR